MNIALISRAKIEDRTFWSGLIENIYFNMKLNSGIKIIKIDNLNNTLRKIYTLKREILNFSNIKFDENYSEVVSKNYCKQIKLKLENYKQIDYILTFDSSLVAYLDVDIPIILWTDLLYKDYYSHYFKKKKISKTSLKSIKNIENRAVKKSHKILLPTKWALNKAKSSYKNLSNKFCLLPFGPNFKKVMNEKYIIKKIKDRSNSRLILTTLSVDWKRKGVEKLLRLKHLLEEKSINVKLNIIGLKKNYNIKDKNINTVKFINKNNIFGEKKIYNYLIHSHFHILFSSAEAYGIALIEANSFGVPNISFKVGGIQNLIKNNINGKIFLNKTKLPVIAKYLQNVFKNKKKYNSLAMSSYRYQKINFNNKNIIKNFIKLIKK